MTIVSYKKHIDPQITRTLQMPLDANLQPLGTELATLSDGLTYVSMQPGAVLPTSQPTEISASIVNPVTLTAAQITEIKLVSPHVKLINEQVVKQIAAQYTTTDEIGIIRVGSTHPNYAAYMAHVDSCKAWGVAEKAKLGL